MQAGGGGSFLFWRENSDLHWVAQVNQTDYFFLNKQGKTNIITPSLYYSPTATDTPLTFVLYRNNVRAYVDNCCGWLLTLLG